MSSALVVGSPLRVGGKALQRSSAIAVLIGLASYQAVSQEAGSRAGDMRHEFAGYWDRAVGTDVWWPVSPGSYEGVPFTPAGLAAQKALEEDPEENYPALRCEFNFGLIVSFADLEIITQPNDRVIMTYPSYEQKIRWIWTDGRDHPEGATDRPMFMGYSVGRWEQGEEGQTLVVETIGVEPGYLRQDGLPNTADIRIAERYTLINDGQDLALELTIDDPNYYTQPWMVSMAYTRGEPPQTLHPVCRVGPEYHGTG